MVFAWFRDQHRRSIAEQPFPTEWMACLTTNVAHYALLDEAEQQELQQDTQIFIAEKYWEGVGGLEITDEMQVTIAAQACLLVLHREHDYYPNVESIILYPTGYTAKDTTPGPDGIVHETLSERLGEAWGNGPVVLSWADVQAGGRNDNDGRNVVFHEFAHKLDMRDGSADGVPRLESDADFDQWAAVMSKEYEALVAQSAHGRASLLDSYGATNAAEFFAVATECFFEKSRQMQQTHGSLYAVMRDFYQQDPAARLEAKITHRHL
jgi:Mlc titration factor MtfA (ptsG expression regulator)